MSDDHDSDSTLPAITGAPGGAPAVVHPETGEVLFEGNEMYAGIATLSLTVEQSAALLEAVPVDQLEIKPTGEVYASQSFYRKKLNQVFGPGRWALRPIGQPLREGNRVYRTFHLLVDGHFIAEAMGEQEYIPNNERMSWGDALEGSKSNALTRACKDLSIASECWDRRFTQRFQDEHCVQVWVEGQKRPQWRRKDARPFYGEKGPVQANGGGDQAGPRRTSDAQRESAQPGGAATGATMGGTPPHQNGGGLISEPQAKRLYARARAAGHSDDDVHKYLLSRWGLASVRDIPRGQYDRVVERIDNVNPFGSLDDDSNEYDPVTDEHADVRS